LIYVAIALPVHVDYIHIRDGDLNCSIPGNNRHQYEISGKAVLIYDEAPNNNWQKINDHSKRDKRSHKLTFQEPLDFLC
jgi:hypothetical protein